jgi:hypothetical protein
MKKGKVKLWHRVILAFLTEKYELKPTSSSISTIFTSYDIFKWGKKYIAHYENEPKTKINKINREKNTKTISKITTTLAASYKDPTRLSDPYLQVVNTGWKTNAPRRKGTRYNIMCLDIHKEWISDETILAKYPNAIDRHPATVQKGGKVAVKRKAPKLKSTPGEPKKEGKDAKDYLFEKGISFADAGRALFEAYKEKVVECKNLKEQLGIAKNETEVWEKTAAEYEKEINSLKADLFIAKRDLKLKEGKAEQFQLGEEL